MSSPGGRGGGGGVPPSPAPPPVDAAERTSLLRGVLASLVPGESSREVLDHTFEGEVSRRRPMSKRKVCLDVVMQEGGVGGGLAILNVEVDAARVGEEEAAHVRADIKVGDVVSVAGIPHRPLHDQPNLLGRILCTSLRVTSKWDTSTRGHYQPPKFAHSNDHAQEDSAKREGADVLPGASIGVLPAGACSVLGEGGGAWTDGASERARDCDASVPLCKAWINTGLCPKGDVCQYRHSTLGLSMGKARADWVREQKRTKRAARVEVEGDVSNEDKQDHRYRAAVFAAWISQTFAKEVSAETSGDAAGQILDVAGGRGDLAWELWVVRGIKSTVIDPRAPKLSKGQHRELKDIAARGETRGGCEDIKGLLVECRKRQVGEPCCCARALIPQRQDLFDSAFWDDERNAPLLKSCALLVGLHPDQATEPIIDYALRTGKPFAVVPCCVFGKENPHRRLPDGRAVSSYEDFVQYLGGKGPGIDRVFLPMDGKNLCLFSRGTSAQTAGLDTGSSFSGV